MIGKIAIIVLFIAAFGSTAAYFISYWKQNGKLLVVGRYLFYLLSFGTFFVAAFLMTNILSHNFQYTYIWSYSSKTLPLHLLISSFYAGQEGSFLLWAFLLALLGVLLLPYAKKYEYESLAMGFYALILLFLMLILIVKSPFDFVWESFASNGVLKDFMPKDGRGLNPVLQNYWIAIHPPILFAGYAAMSVPFVFAVSGLIKKQFSEWINISMPWTLFGSSILGLGIMMGGFWAYETLGWGGFWGWDPVENSSLFPWLVSVALIHTMIVQKGTGGLQKTNYILAVITFLLVLYATFLTRSGILGDTSVHSFVDPGKLVYVLLMVFQVLFVLIGVGLFIIRRKAFSSTRSNFDISSKEFSLSLGSIVILALTIITLIGTSLPIFQEIVGAKKAAVETAFYNQWGLPIAVLILLINALSIYLNWRSTPWNFILRKLYIPLGISVVLTIITIISGVSGLNFIILAFSVWFSLVINVIFLAKYLKNKPSHSGSFISHLGISLLLLGTLASGGFSKSAHLSLYEGQTAKGLGYNFTLKGKNQIDAELKDREKYEYIVQAEKDGDVAEIRPVVYWSSFNDFQAPFFEPGIHKFFAKDLYVSPKSLESDPNSQKVTMVKNDTVPVPLDTTIKMTMLKFDMSKSHMSGASENFTFGVVVQFERNSKISIDTLNAAINMQTQQFSPVWFSLKGTEILVGFTSFVPADDMAQSKAEISFIKDAFNVEVTIKPFINFVWIGTLFVVLGFLVSVKRRIPEKKQV